MSRLAAVAAVALLVAGCSEPTTAPPSLSPSAPLFDVGNPPPPKVNGVTSYAAVEGAGAIIGAGVNGIGVAGAPVVTGSPLASCPGFIFCVPSDYNQNQPPVTFKVLTFNEPGKLPADIRTQLARGGGICGETEGGFIMCSVKVTKKPRIVVNGLTSRGEGVAFDMSSDGSMVTTIVLRQFDADGPAALTCVGEGGVITVETPPAFGQQWVRVTSPGAGDDDEDRGDDDDRGDHGNRARYQMVGTTFSPFFFRSDIAANASCKNVPPGGG